LFNSWFTYVVSSFRFFPLPRHAASSANNTERRLVRGKE
jgi:hypothetical protein